jgi:hypothetical protein
MAARLLVAMPDQRAMRDTGRELSEATEQAFADLMALLWELKPSEDAKGESIPADVKLSDEASTLWGRFVNRNADEQEAADDDQRAALAKLRTYAGRLALVIHCVRQAAGESVDPWTCDAQSLQAGIDLADWFAGEARRVYTMLAVDDDPLADLVAWIKRRGGRVTARDVSRGPRRYRDDVDRAAADLQTLVDDGLGRWRTHTPTERGGRPITQFLLTDNGGDGDETHESQVKIEVMSPSPVSPVGKASGNGRIIL